jgi:hypothetical protein
MGHLTHIVARQWRVEREKENMCFLHRKPYCPPFKTLVALVALQLGTWGLKVLVFAYKNTDPNQIR